jgi:preprotein translocase subunit SecF
MQLLSRTTNIDFIGKRRAALWLSAVLIVVSFASLATRNLNFGLDFTGGVLIEVAYGGPVALEDVRATLAQAGYDNVLVQNFGTSSDVLIRLPPVEEAAAGANLANEVGAVLRTADPSVEVRRNEFVGPQVGEDLAEQGALAMLFATVMIFAYVMLRFRWKFAVGAIAALVHDVIITVGIFSIFGFSFDLSVLAAVLAVIGYSLNDTVVIYDRIRENFRTIRRGTTAEIVNASLNQTLSRTIITALTTLLVLFSLLFLAGETLFGFSMALIVGVLIGTYSSVYVSGAALVYLNVAPTDMIPVRREELDETP